MAEHDVKLVVDPAISDADELCTSYFDDGNTVSTGLVRRRPSVETMITAVSRQGSHASSAAPSVAYPHAPVNSPETQSVASGLSRSLDSAGIAAKLQAMRVGVTAPPGSAAEKDEVKTPTACTKAGTTRGAPVDESTYEHSTWEDIAEEDVTRALARMAMLARDEHNKNGARKSISEYYSARLAKLVEDAEIKFDPTYLR